MYMYIGISIGICICIYVYKYRYMYIDRYLDHIVVHYPMKIRCDGGGRVIVPA